MPTTTRRGDVGGTQWNFPPPAVGLDSATTGRTPFYDPTIRLAEAPSLPASDPLGIEAQQRANSGMPPGARAGLFQKANFSTMYMPRFESDSVGVTGIQTDLVFGVPFPRRETPVLLTPRYRVLFLDGPDFTDVPARVHEAELGIGHFRRINDRWMFNGAVTLGLYADDHSFGDEDAFRVTGRALGIYELTSHWKGIIGVVYLNRAGLSVVPAAGLTYDRGDFKLDLVFPRPRVAWLLPGSTPTAGDQRWVYLQGELGGNIWAVQRTTVASDTLSYGDARVMIGYERKVIGGLSHRWELGYVFNRELEYDSEGFESELDDALFLRAGLTY
ncbi:MAG: DUF6268 family outer membrane beta-barrel protein [Planctomycetota bacterium]